MIFRIFSFFFIFNTHYKFCLRLCSVNRFLQRAYLGCWRMRRCRRRRRRQSRRPGSTLAMETSLWTSCPPFLSPSFSASLYSLFLVFLSWTFSSAPSAVPPPGTQQILPGAPTRAIYFSFFQKWLQYLARLGSYNSLAYSGSNYGADYGYAARSSAVELTDEQRALYPELAELRDKIEQLQESEYNLRSQAVTRTVDGWEIYLSLARNSDNWERLIVVKRASDHWC